MNIVSCDSCKYSTPISNQSYIFCTQYNIACSKLIGCAAGTPKVKTMADFIRSLTDEQMAAFFYSRYTSACTEHNIEVEITVDDVYKELKKEVQ